MKENAIQTAAQKSAAPATERKTVNQIMNNMLDGEKMRSRFDDLLGKRAPQFISSVVSLVNADPKIQMAFYQAPMTVIQAALKAATFDLPIDQNLGYAYIVPFNNTVKLPDGTEEKRMEATFITGWKGIHQMALRSGAYKRINVTDVREGELKSYNRLTEDVVFDFVENDEEREKLPVIGYVGYYRLINGMEKTIYMTRQQIENHERKFRKGKYMGKGWRDNWDAMARKTVYRQLIGKWGIMSIDYKMSPEAAQIAEDMARQIQDEDSALGYTQSDELIESDGYAVDEATGEVLENGTDAAEVKE